MNASESDDRLQKIIRLHSRFIIPLFGMDRGNIVLRGTGFFVSRGVDHYLITANHVFDQKRFPGDVYVWCKEFELTPVRGFQMSTGENQNSDDEDVMVVKLESDFPFPPFEGNFQTLALDYSSLLPENVPRSGWVYLLVGFPETKNEFRKDIEEFNANLFTYRDSSASAEKYSLLGLDPKKYLLVNFNKRSTVEREGKKYSFPKSKGMSGGPIFLLRPDLQTAEGYRITVVGIITRMKKNVSAIQGTDIGVALESIERLDYLKDHGFI